MNTQEETVPAPRSLQSKQAREGEKGIAKVRRPQSHGVGGQGQAWDLPPGGRGCEFTVRLHATVCMLFPWWKGNLTGM